MSERITRFLMLGYDGREELCGTRKLAVTAERKHEAGGDIHELVELRPGESVITAEEREVVEKAKRLIAAQAGPTMPAIEAWDALECAVRALNLKKAGGE